MMKKRRTRRALINSVMSLILCFAMLLGTTFAWFTDSEISGSNVITAGNLDLEVQYTLDGETWNDLDGADDLFQKGLWEPGHTEVVALKIKNNGSLALKYSANMNIVNEKVGTTKDDKDIVLSEILTVGTITHQSGMIGDIMLSLAFANRNAANLDYTDAATFKASNILGSDNKLAAGAEHYLVVKVDMDDEVGNEANHKGAGFEPEIEFGINVLATQYTSESDSFGSDYDQNAEYPEIEEPAVTVSTLEELKAALASGKNVALAADMQVKTGDLKVNGQTFDGKGSTITCISGIANKPVIQTTGGTIKNVNIEKGKSVQGIGAGMTTDNPLTQDLYIESSIIRGDLYAIVGTANNVKIEVSDSTLYGGISYPGASEIIVTDTKFGCDDGPSIQVNEVSGNMSFTNCEFADGYCVNAYAEAAGKTITITNCKVGATTLTAENFKDLLLDDKYDFGDAKSTYVKDCTVIVDGVAVVW